MLEVSPRLLTDHVRGDDCDIVNNFISSDGTCNDTCDIGGRVFPVSEH